MSPSPWKGEGDIVKRGGLPFLVKNPYPLKGKWIKGMGSKLMKNHFKKLL
jgi:hypothetical protein